MTAGAEDDFFGFWGEVEVGFGVPAPQNPLSIGFRLALALPHLLVVVVLGAISVVLAVVGWFAALKLGRLPRSIAVYQMRWLGYLTRVSSYVFLLVDDYPPFSLTPAAYPVRVEIVAAQLSGPAVFFRWVLLIPTFVIWVVAITGLVLVSPIVWILTLANKQTPPLSCFSSIAAVIRYQTRFVAYAVLVTDEYPGRLFGDDDDMGGELRLPLSGDAKSVLIPILIVGAIASSLGAVRLAIGGDPGQAAYGRLEAASVVFEQSVSACPAGPNRLRCLEQAEGTWSAAWQRFGQDIVNGYVYPFSPQKHWAMHVVGASTAVAIALLDSARAKTEAAHAVAYEKVLRLIRRFDSILSGGQAGVSHPNV